MDRDEFEKLAKCAKDDPVYSGQIFKTNETNPYMITAELAGILKTEHQMEADRIKLLYDVTKVCYLCILFFTLKVPTLFPNSKSFLTFSQFL